MKRNLPLIVHPEGQSPLHYITPSYLEMVKQFTQTQKTGQSQLMQIRGQASKDSKINFLSKSWLKFELSGKRELSCKSSTWGVRSISWLQAWVIGKRVLVPDFGHVQF